MFNFFSLTEEESAECARINTDLDTLSDQIQKSQSKSFEDLEKLVNRFNDVYQEKKRLEMVISENHGIKPDALVTVYDGLGIYKF